MRVALKSAGGRRKLVEVASLQEASRAVREYIEADGLGSSAWEGGEVTEGRKVVARVSYNGRVWPPGGCRAGVEPLWCPFAVATGTDAGQALAAAPVDEEDEDEPPGPARAKGKDGAIRYACTTCGTQGCKLWRDWNTFVSHLDLYCVRCACALRPGEVKPEDVDAGGYHDSVYEARDGTTFSMGPTDQLNSLAPAVPTVDGSTFWGYTSVPPAAVAWWRALPTQPLAVPAPAPPVPEEAPADRASPGTVSIIGGTP